MGGSYDSAEHDAAPGSIVVRAQPNDLAFELTPAAARYSDAGHGVLSSLATRVALYGWAPTVAMLVGANAGGAATTLACLGLLPVALAIGAWVVVRRGRAQTVRIRGAQLHIGGWRGSLFDIVGATHEVRVPQTTSGSKHASVASALAHCLVIELRNGPSWVFPVAHPRSEVQWVARLIREAAEKAQQCDGEAPPDLVALMNRQRAAMPPQTIRPQRER